MFVVVVILSPSVSKLFPQTPLHRATSTNSKSCAEVLLQFGADKTLKNVRIYSFGKRDPRIRMQDSFLLSFLSFFLDFFILG